MRVEIDLPNYDSKILPGMYAYGKIIVERPDIRAIPRSALSHAGGKTFVWMYENGKAKRTEVVIGARSGKWVEIIKRATGSKYHGHREWKAITGDGQILLGHRLSTLTEGAHVEIDDTPAPIDLETLQERNNTMGSRGQRPEICFPEKGLSNYRGFGRCLRKKKNETP